MTVGGDHLGFEVVTTAAISALFAVVGAGGFLGGVPTAHSVTQRGNVIADIAVTAGGAGIGGITLLGAGGGGDCGSIVMIGTVRIDVEEINRIIDFCGRSVQIINAGDLYCVYTLVVAHIGRSGVENDAVGNAVSLGVNNQIGINVGVRFTCGTIEDPLSAVGFPCNGDLDAISGCLLVDTVVQRYRPGVLSRE